MTSISPEEGKKFVLVEYDTDKVFGPASEEECSEYQKALQSGKSFFLRGYHGYNLRMKVESRPQG